MGCSTSKDITVARIKTTDSGIFLILGADTGDSKSKWEELAKDGRERAAKGAMPGFDPQQMEVGPMMANPMWGEDMGPHFSVVSVVGEGTADCEGTADPFKTAGGDKKGRKSVDADLRAKAEALAAKRYKLNLSSPKLTFLLGSEQNDAATGGPVFVTAEHEANRKVIDGVREEIGLKHLPSSEPPPLTLCCRRRSQKRLRLSCCGRCFCSKARTFGSSNTKSERSRKQRGIASRGRARIERSSALSAAYTMTRYETRTVVCLTSVPLWCPGLLLATV